MSNDTDKNVTMRRLNVTLVLLWNNIFKNNLLGLYLFVKVVKTRNLITSRYSKLEKEDMEPETIIEFLYLAVG